MIWLNLFLLFCKIYIILSIFSKYLALLLHKLISPPSPEVTTIFLIVVYSHFFPGQKKQVATSLCKPMTMPFLSWPIKQSYSMDYIFQRPQQACHFLKSILSSEKETLSLITFILLPDSTEFQWRKVCHNHNSINHTLLGVNIPSLRCLGTKQFRESKCLTFLVNFTETNSLAVF